MNSIFPQLAKITLATTRTVEMVRFYDMLFDTQLQAKEIQGVTFHNGTLAGIPLLICPNEIAGVEAEQSRHQLALRVADLESLLGRVESVGGLIETPMTESMTEAILRDPDGNTIEVIQAQHNESM